MGRSARPKAYLVLFQLERELRRWNRLDRLSPVASRERAAVEPNFMLAVLLILSQLLKMKREAYFGISILPRSRLLGLCWFSSIGLVTFSTITL